MDPPPPRRVVSFFNTAGVCFVSSDRGFSPQLQRDGWDLRSVLERNRGQSRSQCIGRIGEWPSGRGGGGAAQQQGPIQTLLLFFQVCVLDLRK